MKQPLDEAYLIWLYAQVASPRLKNPTRTYWSLTRQMLTTPYVWFVPNDDNRVSDGIYLREEFALSLPDYVDIDGDWFELECSVLELIIGLSRRLSFESEGEPREWFWHLLENLGITPACADAHYNHEIEGMIGEALDRIIWRTYRYNGQGGLFPLARPSSDQRQVELWYQMNAYLLERD